MQGFLELSARVVWRQSQENWAGILPPWLRPGRSFQQLLLILLNRKCLLVLWAELTFPSSSRWPCCLCVAWMSSHGRSVQLIPGHQWAGVRVWPHHRGETQEPGLLPSAQRMHFRSVTKTCNVLEIELWWLGVAFLSLLFRRGKWVYLRVGSAMRRHVTHGNKSEPHWTET